MNPNAFAHRRYWIRRSPTGGIVAALCGLGTAVFAQEPSTNTVPPADRNLFGQPPALTLDPDALDRMSSRTNAFDVPPVSLPWLPGDAPVVPDWAATGQPGSPFLRPGFGTSSLGNSALPTAVASARRAGGSQPLPIGPFDLSPGLDYQVLYGTGQLSGPGQGEATWQQTISPGLTLYAGDHWTVAYQPSIRLYSTEGYKDTVDHVVTLGGWASLQDWRFRLNHASAITSDPLIETGTQTDQTTHSTAVGASWDRGQRGAFDFSLSQNIRLTEATSDIFSWALQNWYDYPLRPRLKVGVGVGAGYDYSDPGTDMANERVNLRVSGPLGDKITYNASAGFEVRHFVQGDASSSVSPLASAGVTYQVFEKTLFNAGFVYDVGTSYFSDEFTRNTSLQGGVTQFLTERWSLSASGGYRLTSFESSAAGRATTREDGSAFANVSLSAKILPRVTTTFFYSFRGNNSDTEQFSFDSHQVGVSLNWAL